MSDFVNGFWSVYVQGLTALSILFCAYILYANMTKKQPGPVETHGNVWDENLAEYNNPLPSWWMWLFWITLGFSVIYLAVYPGFGSSAGVFQWSSAESAPGKKDGQYYKEMQAADLKYGPIFDKYAKMDLAAVAANPEAKAMGERLFLTYCAQCHGSAAQGAKGFPNLTDSDWLYGGEPDVIKTSISGGRNGVMPPFGHLGADTIKDVSNYVRSLSGLANDGVRAQRGKEVFAQNCAACHGPEAKGTPALGAPNLTDKVWLYGSSEATITETVTGGRTNRMPAFQAFLGDAKVHLLAAYVYGLGGGQKAAAAPPQSAPAEPAASGTPVAKVYFETGKADLPADGLTTLQSIVDFAKANSAAKVAVSGFHDPTGSQAVNEELAKNRAKAIREALKAAGVAEDRIEMRKPQATTGTGDNREARRVEVSVI